MYEKGPAQAPAAHLRFHVQVLQVEAGPSEERREVVEEEGEARRGTFVVPDHDLRPRPLTEEGTAEHLLRGDDLVREALVLRELPYKREDERNIILRSYTYLDGRCWLRCSFRHLHLRGDEGLRDLDGVGGRALE